MKKTILLAGALLLLALGSFAQTKGTLITQAKPAGGDSWGYVNTKGEFVISAQFSKCGEFSAEGLAPIFDGASKSFYFINTKGERLNTDISGYRLGGGILGLGMMGYSEGLVPVAQGKAWGFMDTKGKVAIQLKYDEVSPFHGGYAVARIGKSFMVLNPAGAETPVEGGDVVDVKEFSEGLAPYKTAGKLMGFIRKDGKVAITAQFKSVGYFSNGLAWAKTNDDMIGFINPKGEWVIKAEFAAAKDFDAVSGMARVKVGDKWCYVNKGGERYFIGSAESINDFSEGLAEATKGKLHGFLNSKGEWVIDAQYDDARAFKNGYAAVKQGDKWGFIDKTGKWVISPTFSGVKDMELVK